MGIIGTMAMIIMCITICLNVRIFREEKEEDKELTVGRYLRRHPRTPISFAFYLFLLVSGHVFTMLEDKGVTLNEVALGICYVVVFILVEIWTRHLEKTKENK